MGHILTSGISTFWRKLDDLRDLLATSGTRDTAVAPLLEHLLAQIDAVPEPMAGTRRKMLADLVACHGLTLSQNRAESHLDGGGPWPLEALTAPSLPGVTLVTCCKNRNENLLRALPTWLSRPEISEVLDATDHSAGENPFYS